MSEIETINKMIDATLELVFKVERRLRTLEAEVSELAEKYHELTKNHEMHPYRGIHAR